MSRTTTASSSTMHTHATPSLANILVGMDYPEFPVPVGVFRDVDAPTFDELVQKQVDEAVAKGRGSLDAVLRAGETWVVD